MRVFINWAMQAISFSGSISYLHVWKPISTLSLLCVFKQGSTIPLRAWHGDFYFFWSLLLGYGELHFQIFKKSVTCIVRSSQGLMLWNRSSHEKRLHTIIPLCSSGWFLCCWWFREDGLLLVPCLRAKKNTRSWQNPNPLILHTKLAGTFPLVEIVIRTTKWRQHLRE
jgi:hypothetical protein